MSALALGRRAAEAQMVDRCRIERRTGHTVQDEDTGREVPEVVVVFRERCRVKTTGQPRETTVGGREVTLLGLQLELPVSAPPVRVDDVAVLESVGALSDVQLLGTRYRILAAMAETSSTRRRLPVEVVQ